MLLHRDAPTGRILDGNNNPIILVGGHYYLFQHDGRGDYGINFGGQPTPEFTFGDVEPCSVGTFAGSAELWPAANGIGAELFSTMKGQHLNLLRIFLTNSYTTNDLFPYKVNASDQKLEVEDAVEHGHWNDAYFARLLTFAQQANLAGIALQLSVFNFFDFDLNAWPHSPWNPANTHDISANWSAIHLVANAASREARCANFINGNDNLTKVKRAFIQKLVTTLRPQGNVTQGNVIFELMNEPRGAALKDQAKFLSQVAGLLLEAFGSWRPLLSVNAFPPLPSSQTLDIEQWKADQLAHFDDIDIVSYHGLSGMAVHEGACPAKEDDRKAAFFSCVDRGSIGERRGKHFGAFSQKALIFSTDGAQQYKRVYTGGSMSIRDGQIRTPLSNQSTARPFILRHFSDLGNWAYWCLREAVANPGRCHFQNHSSFYRTILLIQKSYASASADGTGGGNEFTPPYDPETWTHWQSSSIPPNDFKTAVHFNANTGELVVQLGTVASQADVAQAGANGIGFLHRFTAVTNLVRAKASYSPTSVTVRSTGATVIPAVALRIHIINPDGSVGGLIKRQPVPLQHGAPSGNIELSAGVTAGQQYGLILEANVGVQYKNRWQGYGEVIVRFLEATLIL